MFLKAKLPPSTKRVELHTSEWVNDRIKQGTLENIEKYQGADEATLTRRIQGLNAEWDTERVLEANAATLILVSTILGFVVNQYWFILVGVVSFFLLQHAVQGWCPLCQSLED